MSRKFLFCFPLRIGNLVFGCIVIVISLAVAAYSLYELIMNFKPDGEFISNEKFNNWEHLESFFGRDKSGIVATVTMSYYLSYIVISMLLLFFALILVVGSYQANQCLVTMFFVYSFFHLFLTVMLIVWEATTAGYIQLGLIAIADVLLIICLFGVKYLMEAIRTGHVYSRPGKVFHNY